MLGSIRYNLAHLADFSGRDARQTFWYYILFLVLLNVAISLAVSVPMMAGMMGSAYTAARTGATEAEVAAHMGGEMGSWLATSMWVSAATSFLMLLLALAAFVRRLHDSDHSGWWAALAAVAQLAGIAISLSMIGEIRSVMDVAMSDPANFQQTFEAHSEMRSYSLIGWIAPIIVIVFGIMKSSDGPNRFGEEPVRF